MPELRARLVWIEPRKAVDTRAGRWLLVIIGLVAAATAVLTAVTKPASNHNLPHVLAVAVHGQSCRWQDAGRAFGYAFVFQVLNVLLGVGFGVLCRSTPAAIVAYFVIPTGWSILTGTVSAMAATGRWLGPSTAWNHLAGGAVTATTWAQVAITAAAWIALPALVGGWHVLHRPVNA